MPPSGRGEENDRRLSPRGAADADALAAELSRLPIAAIYSSPYPRAEQTARPLAAKLGLAVQIVPDLRERLLSTAPLDDWYAEVRRTWEDFEYALPGGESNRAAQDRATRVLADLAARHPDGTIVAASHGNLIAVALRAHDDAVGFDFWEAMPMPAVYELEIAAGNPEPAATDGGVLGRG